MSPDGRRWIWLAVGAFLSAIAVATSAAGAHVAEAGLDDSALRSFSAAARMLLVHGPAVCIVAALLERTHSRGMEVAAAFFVTGAVLFSGALFLAALSGSKFFGRTAPFGGLAFIAGWLVLAFEAARHALRAFRARGR